MPGTAYKVRVGAEGDSGFVSSEDVFETGPGEVHTTPDLLMLRGAATGHSGGDGGKMVLWIGLNVSLWGPVGLGVGLLIVFGFLYEMNYRIEQIIF